MRKETSCGIIPLRHDRGQWSVLLVQLHAGHWGFPKGHIESNEEIQETAIRELQEETGLTVKRFLSDIVLKEVYHFTHQGIAIEKTVLYYIAEVVGKVVIQEEEIKATKWVPLEDSVAAISFPAGKTLCEQVMQILG